jgi:hypothetical protein
MASKSETVKTLEAVALRLTFADQAGRLIAIFGADPEVEESWQRRVDRRQSEIENGTVSLFLGPQTLARLKAEFESTTPYPDFPLGQTWSI